MQKTPKAAKKMAQYKSVSAKEVVEEAMVNLERPTNPNLFRGLGWVENYSRMSGFSVERNLQYARVDITDDIIEKPADLNATRQVYLQAGDHVTEVAWADEHLDARLWGRGGASLYRGERGAPVLAESEKHYFFQGGNPDIYDCAHILYTGIKRDKDGYVLIPEEHKYAAIEYVEYQMMKSERRRNKNAHTAQEIQEKWGLVERAMGVAAGQEAMPDIQILMEEALQRFGINLPTPITRVRSSRR